MVRIIRVVPFTVLIPVSLLGVVISGMLDPSPWSMVVFYTFGLPYFGAALTTVVLGHGSGLSPSWVTVVGLCLLVDVAVVFPLRRILAGGGPRGWR